MPTHTPTLVPTQPPTPSPPQVPTQAQNCSENVSPSYAILDFLVFLDAASPDLATGVNAGAFGVCYCVCGFVYFPDHKL